MFPFPNPNPAGWSGIQPVTAEQITQINANAAAAADGSRWSDYAHLKNWRFGAWSSIDIFSNGATQYVPADLRTQTFIHWIPGPDVWLRSSDYLGQHLLYISRDHGFRFRSLPTPALDRKPWLAASKESTGETIVVCNPSSSSDNWKLLSFTIPAPMLTSGTVDDEIGVDYATIDMGFAPGAMTGVSVQDVLWVPERQWWMLGFVGTNGGIKTSTDLATWTNRAVGVMDATHGVRRIVGNGDGTYLATNSATDAAYGVSTDGGETWEMNNLPFDHGSGMRMAYVPDLGQFVSFNNFPLPEGLVYTSPTGLEGDWTVTTSLSVKDAVGWGRVLLAIMDPTGDNTNQQVVASIDAGANWFRVGSDRDGYNTLKFNGKQAALQTAAIPTNGSDSAFICSDVAG